MRKPFSLSRNPGRERENLNAKLFILVTVLFLVLGACSTSQSLKGSKWDQTKQAFDTNCMFFPLACIPWAGMEAVDGVKHIAKEGLERRNEELGQEDREITLKDGTKITIPAKRKSEKTYGMVPEDLEKFLAEHREIETVSAKEQPIPPTKPDTEPTNSGEDTAKE